jgi:hypothetical protein
MIYPAMSVLIPAAILTAVLLAAVWYLWGLSYAADFRQPRPVKPQVTGDLVERFLARLIAANEAVVPSGEAKPAEVTASGTCADHDGHGFKKVA